MPDASGARVAAGVARLADTLARARDSDIWHSFRSSRVTVTAALVTMVMMLAALFAPCRRGRTVLG